MAMKLFIIGLSIVLLITACKSRDQETQSRANNRTAAATPDATSAATSAAPSATGKSKFDACSLLTNDDLKAVQGEPPAQALGSERSEARFTVTQCYYSLPTVSNSVVLNVTTAAQGADSRSVREYWNQTFANKEKTRARDREAKERKGEEEGANAERVAGIGEEAYWTANRVGGALYVLRKDLFFRISVGGAGDTNTKLAKSKTLARKVLQRL
jgi:hypothetical protein